MVVKGDMCGWGGSAEGNNFKYALRDFVFLVTRRGQTLSSYGGGGGGLVLDR